MVGVPASAIVAEGQSSSGRVCVVGKWCCADSGFFVLNFVTYLFSGYGEKRNFYCFSF